MSGTPVLTIPRPEAGKLAVERFQDVEDVIENNKRLQNEPQDRRQPWRHVASIPNIFIEKWLMELWRAGAHHVRMFDAEFDAYVEKKLADPDWKWLRTDAPHR